MDRKQKPSVMITPYPGDSFLYESSPSSQDRELLEQSNMPTCQELSTNLFAGSRRFRPISKALYDSNQIRGPNGSVRGHRDVVKRSLESIKIVASKDMRNFNLSNLQTFMASAATTTKGDSKTEASQQMQVFEQDRLEYLNHLTEEEQNLCVLYTTSLGVIRRSFEDSKFMRLTLDSNLIKYEERDIYLNHEYKQQLKARCQSILVPVLFVEGSLLGGAKELELMNESGDLALSLAKFRTPMAQRDTCRCCGNAKFIACQSCNGSRRSTIHHFRFNSIALRCIKCDQNDGLVKCPVCFAATKGEP